MSPTWWQRNVGWLLALIPLAGLAFLATSHHLVMLYMPEHPVSALVAEDGQAHVKQEILRHLHDGTPVTFELEVTVRLVAVEPVDRFDTEIAVAGATLWRVDLEFEAPSDQPIPICSMQVIADGVAYTAAGARIRENPDDRAADSHYCTPVGTPGPTLDVATGQFIDDDPPRPPKWQTSEAFALPDGVTPDTVKLWWRPPGYVLFPVVAP